MDLTQAMHAATQDPPPTGIDVDQLITGERRRTRRLHAAAGVALVAALVAGAVTVPQLLSRTGQSPGLTPATAAATPAQPEGTCPTVAPNAEEACEAALKRLNQALAETLRRVLPDLSGPLLLSRSGAGYEMFKQLSDSGAVLAVRLRSTGGNAADDEAFAAKHCAGCRQETRQGILLLVRSATEVWSIRPDGTAVNVITRGATSITEQQLTEIALTPGLTLTR